MVGSTELIRSWCSSEMTVKDEPNAVGKQRSVFFIDMRSLRVHFRLFNTGK